MIAEITAAIVAVMVVIVFFAYMRIINIAKDASETKQKVECMIIKQDMNSKDLSFKLDSLAKRITAFEAYKDVFEEQRANIAEYKKELEKKKADEERKDANRKRNYAEIVARRQNGEKLSNIAKDFGVKTSELDGFCRYMEAQLKDEEAGAGCENEQECPADAN